MSSIDPTLPTWQPLPATNDLSLMAVSIAANTRRSYLGALRLFERSGQPRTDEGIATYLESLFEAGRSPACASLLTAALRFTANLAGEKSPMGPLTERTLAGFRRSGATRGRGQVGGISWEEVDAIIDYLHTQPRMLRNVRDRALIGIMSDALLRVGEAQALEVSHINTTDHTLVVARSKTDQEGRGFTLYMGPRTTEDIEQWVTSADLVVGPLFRSLTRRGRIMEGMSSQSIRRVICRRAKEAGITRWVSGHSLRIGAAQSLAAKGATLVEMQVVGRWKSPNMPAHYARSQAAKRGVVARLRYGEGNDE